MTTTIEQARALSVASKAEAEQEACQLVHDIVSHADLDPATVEPILHGNGWTWEHIEDAPEADIGNEAALREFFKWHPKSEVLRLRLRRLWSATIEAAAAAESRRAEIERELAAERERFAPMLAAHNAKLQGLQSQLPPVALIWEATSARNELIRTAPEAITRREQELAAERARLVHRADALKEHLATAGRGAERELEAAERENERLKSSATKERLARAQAAVAKADEAAKRPAQELAEINERLAAIETEVGQLHKAKLAP